MDASSSKSLRATAAVVFGIHGSIGTDQGSAHVKEEPSNSFVVSKFEDKYDRFMPLSRMVNNCKRNSE